MDSLGYSEHSDVIDSVVAPTTAEIRLLENHNVDHAKFDQCMYVTVHVMCLSCDDVTWCYRCEDTRSLQTIHRAVERELKKDALGETEKKVTKADFARRATRQKALEWIGSTGKENVVLCSFEIATLCTTIHLCMDFILNSLSL